ncbi:HAD family hydrolase [Amnibacterium kyonggiense]|uniref:Putative hydrolase of the HAD superfamily n=1 Tax=Amnibacterium kyonggiense TaxID=595671 RepID=A0A4R7FKU6_9MICO|nr:HAD family hydrolase [Amnibacterium kyonggiense]TDS76977.1 putative hydrolase of the HAD superfamily [Amnibacterium kyonggiense]
MSDVRTVLLDLDGVLMDHTSAAREAVRAWLGARLTPEVEAAWFAAQDLRLAQWRAGGLGWEEQRRARLRDVLPVLGERIGTDDELDAQWASGYGAAYRRSWHGFEDAGPAIRALHDAGVRTAVLTNGAEDQQTAKLRTIGLLDLVGPVLTAGALGLRKPDPRAFLVACERIGADPSAVLYVGDEHEVDVLGARGAGLGAVLLDRDGTAPPDETAVIRSLAELPALVR